MIRVLFVCHGNICRSPMAEYVFKKLIADEGLEYAFHIASAGTSDEEHGNPVYPPIRRILKREGINCDSHRACRMNKEDYNKYDLLICMDAYNVRNLMRIIGADPAGKVHLLMEYTMRNHAAGNAASCKHPAPDVADPYYSGDYEAASADIHAGCSALLEKLKEDYDL